MASVSVKSSEESGLLQFAQSIEPEGFECRHLGHSRDGAGAAIAIPDSRIGFTDLPIMSDRAAIGGIWADRTTARDPSVRDFGVEPGADVAERGHGMRFSTGR